MYAKRLESGHDMHRAEFNMPNISMQQVDSFVRNFDTKSTDPLVESMTVISRDETHKYATVTRIITKIPMMTKRESIMAMKRMELPSGEVCWLSNTIEHPDYPKNDQYVRIDWFKGMKFSPQPDGSMSVTEFLQFDMGGYFPVSMLNMIQTNAVSKETQELFDGMSKE